MLQGVAGAMPWSKTIEGHSSIVGGRPLCNFLR